MSLQELILALAPLDIQRAIKKILAATTPEELKKLLIKAISESALVSVALTLTSGKSANDELIALSALSVEKQEVAIQSLFSRQGSNQGRMSQSAQLALVSVVINQLALTEVSTEDAMAIQRYSRDLINNVAQVEQGAFTHFSLLAEVEHQGKKELRAFHLDFRVLLGSSTEVSAAIAFELLKMGAKPDSQFFTAFTSLAQVGALLHVHGKSLDSLVLQRGKASLADLASSILHQGTIDLSQITGEHISMDALVANAKRHTSGYEITLSGKKAFGSTEQLDSNTVHRVLSALAIIQQTVAAVIDPKSQAQLGLTSLVGTSSSYLTLAEGKTFTGIDGLHSDICVKEIEDTDKECVGHGDEEYLDGYKLKYKADASIVARFNNLLMGLNLHHQRLVEKYSNSESKKYVIGTSQILLDNLNTALVSYNDNGDLAVFVAHCKKAVDGAKVDFNTHRDNVFNRFLGSLVEWISNLFAAKDQISNAHNRAMFFNPSPSIRETTAAKVLYEFHQGIELLASNDSFYEHEDMRNLVLVGVVNSLLNKKQ